MAESKLGVIHYNWPGYDLEGFAARASEIGYKYCELQINDIWDGETDNGEATATATRRLLEKYGMQASAVAAGNDFLQADPAVLEAQIERYRYVCQIIPHVGTDIVRSDGGWNRKGEVPEDQWDGMMLESFKRCAEFLEELDVRIALDSARAVAVTFDVTLPADTPADAVVRMAGNVFQLGAYRIHQNQPRTVQDVDLVPLERVSATRARGAFALHQGTYLDYYYTLSGTYYGREYVDESQLAYRGRS